MKFFDLRSEGEIEVLKSVLVSENLDLPLVVSIPHSSCLVPVEFLKFRKFDKNILRDTDVGTDVLYDFGFGSKVVGLCNPYFVNYSRSRSSFLDSRGVFAWEFLDGSSIWKKDYSRIEVDNILRDYYDVFHLELERLVKLVRKEFGFCLLIDGHSMAKYDLKSKKKRSDVCFGTLDGRSVDLKIEKFILDFCSNYDFSVSFNEPYKGGFITQKFADWENVFVIQIESVKENYIDNYDLGDYNLLNLEFDEFHSFLKELVFNLSQELLNRE